MDAGVTTGPGRGPADYERMQRRHSRVSGPMLHSLAATYAWHQPAVCPPAHTARAFTKRVEVCSTPSEQFTAPITHPCHMMMHVEGIRDHATGEAMQVSGSNFEYKIRAKLMMSGLHAGSYSGMKILLDCTVSQTSLSGVRGCSQTLGARLWRSWMSRLVTARQ